MNTIISKILEELKAVPVTLMFLAALYIAVSILWNDHVSKADFTELKGQLVGVQYTLQRDHMDSRLRNVETELFNLNQHIIEEKAKGKDIDSLYFQRIDDLKNQHDELMRQINRLDQLNKLDLSQ